MFGTTTEKTRRIVVQLPNGHRVGGQLRVAHLMTKAIDFFVIYVPKQASARGAQTVLTVLAYGADARLIGRARVP
jgi:hypothetical protein